MLLHQFLVAVAPKLRPILNKDSLPRFYGLCNGLSQYMGLRGFIYPEILTSMVSKNAVRCARAALQGGDWLRGRRADPNGCHPYGFMPLHVAAETFSVEMVKLLLRHGASANLRTKGEQVIEGLLPLHVAVENTSMHKYLEDHWADGRPLDSLISLLCLPEMVCHEQILEQVSSILNSKGIVPSGKVIDTASLTCYQYPGQTSIYKPASRVDTGGTNEADKSYTLNAEGFKRIPAKQPPKGLAIREVRDKFFPYWKSVLSARLQVKMLPPCEPSRKDIQRTEPRPSKSMGNLGSASRSRLASNYECRRQLCDVASMALKVFRRT